MPRAHTPDEKRAIRDRLLASGRDRFARFGLHKTTIAELARGAGIGKGSFYQFYDSKEELFMAVQEDEESRFKSELVAEIEAAGDGRAAVVALLECVATRLDRHPFLRTLLDPQTLQVLTLRLSAERLAEHRERDRSFFLELARSWQQRGWLRDDVDPDGFFAVLAAMFAISLQREMIGEGIVEVATREIAEAVADRWCAPAR
jgi:AcrR family transcriptional regulator